MSCVICRRRSCACGMRESTRHANRGRFRQRGCGEPRACQEGSTMEALNALSPYDTSIRGREHWPNWFGDHLALACCADEKAIVLAGGQRSGRAPEFPDHQTGRRTRQRVPARHRFYLSSRAIGVGLAASASHVCSGAAWSRKSGAAQARGSRPQPHRRVDLPQPVDG